MFEYEENDKIVGIIFMWALAKNCSSERWVQEYLTEKSERYLSYNIPLDKWLEMHPLLPEFNEDNILKVIKFFDHHIGFENMSFDMVMYGVTDESWMNTKKEIYDRNFKNFWSIIGSTYGIHLMIGDELDNMNFDFKQLSRHVKLSQL